MSNEQIRVSHDICMAVRDEDDISDLGGLGREMRSVTGGQKSSWKSTISSAGQNGDGTSVAIFDDKHRVFSDLVSPRLPSASHWSSGKHSTSVVLPE